MSQVPEIAKNLYVFKARVVRVVDGDTIDAEVDLGFGVTITQRFRIIGFDAPEIFRPRNEKEKEHGMKATDFAANLLSGTEIYIRSEKTPGIYGRYAAQVWLPSGKDFAELMIENGFQKLDNY